MAGIKSADHHGSHRRLIWPADDSIPQAKVDAIIVPTTRPVAYLKEAAGAALHLGCPLVTLHSGKWTSAHTVATYLGRSVDLIAIDLPDPDHLRLPVLETSRLLAGTMFERRTDVSTKRNLALMLSHMLDWERVVFLDDDIRVPDPGDLGKAVGLLDTHTAVGLGVGGFPDNSVVCHAFRDAGGLQETFIGGGALAVEVKRNHSFFPDIYNEDWFYVLDAGKRLQSIATVGSVLQYRYDPYRPERARAEELGDVLAEGTFWLLDQDMTASDGDLAYWGDFLGKRKRFIEQVMDMVERSASIGSAERARMVEALKAARGRLACISPGLCMAYLQAWVADQEEWQYHIQSVRQMHEQPRERALKSLARRGGAPLTWCTSEHCSMPGPPRRPGQRPLSGRGLRPLLPSNLRSPMSVSLLLPREFPEAHGTLPALTIADVTPSHPPHALIAADVALAGQEGQAEGNDHNDEGPSQQLHP